MTGDSRLLEEWRLPERIVLAADIGLDRASYHALVQAIAELLKDESHSLSIRLLRVHSLMSGAVAEYGRGSRATPAFAGWMTEMNSAGGRRWLLHEATNWGPGRSGRQRMAIAPLISAVETDLRRGAVGSGIRNPLLMASMIANSRSNLYLPSLAREVPLAQMSRARFDQDTPELSALLTGRLVEWVSEGFLLRHVSLYKGTQYLLLCSALVRWYATASAVAVGRDEASAAQLADALDIVERRYATGETPQGYLAGRRLLTLLFGLMMDLMASPADLAFNPYAPPPSPAS